jgi:hypothetical protein
MKTTLNQLIAAIDRAENYFGCAAKAWETGNNSGDSETMRRAEARCDRLRRQGEEVLAPFGIECDCPGLYPSFAVNGFTYHSVQSALDAVVGEIVFEPTEAQTV